MKKLMCVVGFCCAILLSGCKHGTSAATGTSSTVSSTTSTKLSDQQVATIGMTIQTASYAAADLGFKSWYSKDVAALTVAQQLDANINITLIPYFSGKTIDPGMTALGILNSGIFNKDLPPDVSLILTAGMAMLDSYVNVPDSNTFLNTTQTTFILRALNGLDGGLQAFITNPGNPPKIKNVAAKKVVTPAK